MPKTMQFCKGHAILGYLINLGVKIIGTLNTWTVKTKIRLLFSWKISGLNRVYIIFYSARNDRRIYNVQILGQMR